MPYRRLTLPALALALATSLPAGLAHAASVSAEASIRQFSIELIDLDPNDGITPFISFSNVTYDASSEYRLNGGATTLLRDSLDSAGSTGVTGPVGSASTSSTATSWSSAATLDGNPAGSPVALAAIFYRASYILSPATRAVFTFEGDISAPSASGPGYSTASAFMASELYVYPDDWSHPRSFSLLGQSPGAFSYTGEVRSLAGEQASGMLQLSTGVEAYLYGPAAPVPEPSTYAMLLAGVAIVGAARRRRTRR